MNSVSDPSLMLGEAGIGHFILRIMDMSVPSVLFIASEAKQRIEKNYKLLQQSYINKYFSFTLSRIDQSIGKESFLLSKVTFEVGKNITDVEKTIGVIEQYISTGSNSLEKIVGENFYLEKKAFGLYLEITDHTQEYLRSLLKESITNLNWLQNKYCLEDGCRVVKSKYKFGHTDNDFCEKDSFLLIYQQDNQIIIKEISLFTYGIFSSIKEPALFIDIFSSLQETFDIEPKTLSQVMERTKAQLTAAYKAGLVNIF
jgi:hypothetical protein